MGLTYGTLTAMGSASNLNSLSNAQAKPLGAIDLSAGFHDCEIYVQATLASSGVSATGTLQIYGLRSTDNTDWTDGIAPGGTGDIASSIKNADLLAELAANANSQVVRYNLNLGDAQGALSQYHAIVVKNNSGAALAASGHAAKYQTKQYT